MSSHKNLNLKPVPAVYLGPVYGALYETAGRLPSQKIEQDVFAKLLLISRVMGIPMERRCTGLRVQDSQLVVLAAQRICKSGLQSRIKKIGNATQLQAACREKIVAAHRLLEQILAEVGIKSSSELAAAYLHCHRPNAFALVGGQARIGAKLLMESWGCDSSDLSRVSRPGGYAVWLEAVELMTGRLQMKWPNKFGLLQLNDHIEQFALAEFQ